MRSFMFRGTGGGLIRGTTSEAILCTLVAARDRALEKVGKDNIAKLVVYGSDQTHSTYTKACQIAGFLPSNIRSIPTLADTDFSLDPVQVMRAMKADVEAGLMPVYVCATVGTTSSTAVDPVKDLADVAERFDTWLHVDAAYAGSACICPEFRQYLDGVERADSVSISPHKWLLTYLDCCCLWVKKPSLLAKGLSIDPEYLRNKPSESKSVVDYKDWQVGVGRRFRALRLWLVLRSHGVANLQTHIWSDVRMAKALEALVAADPRFEIVVPRRFSLVCFRLNPPGKFDSVDELNRKLLDSINSTGRVYMTHTIVGGVYLLRFAVGATVTEERHVDAAWKLIKEKADALVGKI
eukprot:TRINITY_DN9325_c4_g1_i1.p1 TRINITY_DN9325_c4_g1~~TRINITY_DN9325_c4_g1_i1.p1  ORF type:complete len:352 (-),score=28.03 TRINITY_DN9325_c4_g1_i1:84-1139(-)